jgi:hypothetical protein
VASANRYTYDILEVIQEVLELDEDELSFEVGELGQVSGT